MAEFRRASLAEQVFQKLENDIILGVYPRGEILTELKLVEKLGVSRTPIREALRSLEQERLIEDTGKGSVVPGITREDLIDIMRIRESVEAMASYYAAKNITEESQKELQHILDLHEFYSEKHDLEHLRKIDEAFHDTICSMSKRTVIIDTLLPLHRKTRRYRQNSITSEARMNAMRVEHSAICRAIINADADKAAQLTKEHIGNALNNMLERMNDNG